ncbi:MAG: tRNA (cytidine(34)-2'-O)-methyltransferase [Clostridia bacterium]|nr:MAG: tRNA (cytidine(34)-2'-O)-methyltransferase [Clostridia bacterium]
MHPGRWAIGASLTVADRLGSGAFFRGDTLHVVLVEPEIPQNTGNVARTCAVTGTTLHMVGPLGFSLSDRYLKRAGLDYWPLVDLRYHQAWAEVEVELAGRPFYLAATKARRSYAEVTYPPDSVLVFGAETKGLPPELLARYSGSLIRIPMRPGLRSLNLSNSVAIVLYEALRQQGFSGLE